MPKKNPAPTPTPTPTEPTSVFAPKKPVKSSFGSSTQTKSAFDPTNKPQPKPVKAPTQSGPNFGDQVWSGIKTTIDVASTPLYFVEGWYNEIVKGSRQIVANDAAKMATGTRPKTNPKTQITLGSAINAGAKNSLSWTRGEPTITGSDITGNPISGFAVDVLFDPVTHGLGRVLSVGVKAGATGAKTAIKAATIARQGEISAARAERLTGQAVVKSPLKEGKSVLDQYTTKPVIRQNLKRSTGAVGETLAKLDEKLATKYLYQTTPANKSITNTLVSALEAGYKGTAARVLLEGTKHDLQRIVRTEAKQTKTIAKQAEKTAQQAAEAVGIKPMIPHISSDGVHVFDGKALYQFKTEKEATDWIAGQTGKTVTKTEVTRGLPPVVDTVPKDAIVVAAEAVKTATPAAKDAKKLLTTIENIAKKTTGISQGANLSNKIGAIINRADGAIAIPEQAKLTLTQVVKNKADGFAAIRNLMGKNGAPEVARTLLGRELLTANGKKITIDALIKGNVPWEKLGKEGQAQVILNMKNLLTPASGATTNKLAELTKIAGKDIADKIAKTGILEGKTVDPKIIKTILDSLPSGETKIYAGFMDLINGIKKGDVVEMGILQKLVKAIDPENTAIKQVAKAAENPDTRKQLENILIAKGENTLYGIQRRQELADAATFMEAQGVGFPDVMSLYTEDRLLGRINPSQVAVDDARLAASLRIKNWADGGLGSKLNRVYESVAEGLSANLKYIQDILDSPNVVVGVSTVKDMAARNTEKAFQVKTNAAILQQLNQSGEAKIWGNMFGLIRRDLSYTKQGGRSIQKTPVPKEMMKEFLLRGQMAEDAILATTGARIVWKKTAALAKGQKHYIFCSLPKVVEIFSKTAEGEAIALKALFPNTARLGILKTDALSTVGIAKATRRVIEAAEKNTPLDVAEVVKDLKSRGELQTPWSDTFKKEADGIAKTFAEHLTKPETIAAIQNSHISRASASVEDVAQSATAMVDDLYKSLVEGWKANLNKNIDSTTARADLVREWFNKFVYASGIFKNQDGEVAQAVFQAAANIFVRNGRLTKLIADSAETMPTLIGRANSTNEAERELANLIQTEINSYFKHQNAALNTQLERIPFPTAEAVTKATDKLTEITLAYEQHIGARLPNFTKAQATEWAKKFTTLQTKLDAAREAASNVGVPTKHWDGEKWVATNRFDHKTAVEKANAAAESYVKTDEGVVKMAVHDSLPVARKVGVKKSAELRQKWLEENNALTAEKMNGAKQDIAEGILNRIGEFEQIGLDSAEQGRRIWQETIARTYDEASLDVINTVTGPTSPMKASNLLSGEIKPAKFAEGASNTAGKWDVRPMLSRAETSVMTDISNVADYMHAVRKKFIGRNLGPEKFQQAFNIALSKTTPAGAVDESVLALAEHLRKVIDAVFGTPEASKIAEAGITDQQLAAALRKFNLDINELFPKGMTPSQMADMVKFLPFADNLAAEGDTALEAIAAERKAAFEKSGKDPFIILTNLISAIQFAKTERTFITDFSTRFGWKGEFNTAKEAVAAGWVKIQGQSIGGTNLSEFLPSPENGGLFPPELAKQFLSLNREWNVIFNGKAMNSTVRTIMTATGFMKASQTVMRMGHHVGNMMGDFTAAIIGGMRNPIHLKQGLEIAYADAKQDVRTVIGRDKLDYKFVRTMEGLDNKSKAFEIADKTGKMQPGIVLNKNGKNVKVMITTEELRQAFKERGIIIGNIFQDDIAGLYESVISDATLTGARNEVRKVIVSKINQGIGAVERPFGSVASYYGNALRAGHALSVIQSRSWKNVNEALDAALEQVNRYHPTIQSLAGKDRRTGRMIFTYYTWLRVAHNAVLDMAMNHEVAMLTTFKAKHTQEEQAGMAPPSIGNAWADTQNTPSYLNQSIYGPSMTGPQGPTVTGESIMPLDVADTWKFTYDPARTLQENIAGNLWSGNTVGNTGWSIGRVIGGNLNPFLRRPLELISGGDLQTGTPSRIKTIQDLVESLAGDFGPTQLAKGLGWWTPTNKLPQNTTNPMTDADRQQILQNWLSGQKQKPIYTPANLKNAYTEQNARAKSLWEIMNGQK